jgi:hypothetical protein
VSLQHRSLTAERWVRFSFDQRVLMIGNEMNRAAKLLSPPDFERLRACYERVLTLIDLSVQVEDRPSRRRELLRWRDLIADLYIQEAADSTAHAAAFLCLLRFTPVAAAQIPLVLGPTTPSTTSAG